MTDRDKNNGLEGHIECQSILVHPEIIEELRAMTPDEAVLLRLSEFFKIFGDPTRMKILYALFTHELCVCDLSVIIGMSQSAVSHQLKMLRQANLVSYQREGKSVLYSLRDDHVRQIVKTGMEHIAEKS